MRFRNSVRPLALIASAAGLLLGAFACTTQVVNGISTGGGGGHGTGGHLECSKNADCSGAYRICNKTQGRCVNLTSDLCTTIVGTSDDAYKDDSAILFGSILPTVGLDQWIGRVQEDGVRLALDDFAKVGGLPSPSGGPNRPIVLVGCNDGPDEDRAVEAAIHLADDLGVPAIIGHSFSGSTIDIALEVTIPKGILLFSPSATSRDISMLVDDDLIWRTSPSDVFQATALATYFPTVEKAARARYGLLPADPIKVAIVHNSTSYGLGLADALEATLEFNALPALAQLGMGYERFDYGAPEAPNLGTAVAVVDFAPHVIVLFGLGEGVDPMMKTIEAQWTDPTHRSFFVLSDAGQVTDLWDQVITTEDLRTRVTGTMPGASTSYLPYATFTAAWSSSKYAMGGSLDGFYAAGAYDILYLLAYSAVALGDQPSTGANLVEYGLRNMVSNPGVSKVRIGAGSEAIQATFATLATGEPIDIEGVTGPLDFDTFGEAPSDVQIWCVPKGSGGLAAGPAINSGVHYDAAKNLILGELSPECALPK